MIKDLIQTWRGGRLPMIYNVINSQRKIDMNCDIWLNVTFYYTNELDSSESADNTLLKYHQL